MPHIPDHAELTNLAAALAKRAAVEIPAITNHETLDDGREVLQRKDGAKLQYLVTEERTGDAYNVKVTTDYSVAEDEAGTMHKMEGLRVIFEDELTEQLYDHRIVPWATQRQAS